DTERMAFALMPKERADEFMTHSEADFAHSVAGMGRFRVNVFRQRGSVGLVFRRVLPGTPSFEALGLPPVVRRLAEEPRGMILVTGPTGSGKTTTIEAMIAHINESMSVNMVIVEDPFESLHPDKKSTFNQSMCNLYKNWLQSLLYAMSVASHPHDYRTALQQAGLSAS